MNSRLLPALLVLALSCQLPARAELFRPETVKGALIGGVAGAIIGHNNDRRGWEGAGYGMAAGAIVGSIVGDARAHDARHRHYVDRYRHDRYRNWDSGVRWHVGVGYHQGHSNRWGYRDRWAHRGHLHTSPPLAWRLGAYHRDPWAIGHSRRVYDRYSHGSYAGRGAFWGGLAGAIIGHNNGRRGWEGAGYGAAGGYILGTLADARVRQRAAEADAAEAWARASERPAPTASPTNITINNYYAAPAPASPMAAANRAFGR